MPTFFSDFLDNNEFILDEVESRHLVRVLRIKEGEEVKIINGSGTLYIGVIKRADPRRTVVTITNKIDEYNKRKYYLHIAIAPTKNIDRFEWFVEKSVEMGIDEITPIICERSERRTIKNERINKIIISAMKQSGNAKITTLNPIISVNEFANYNRKGQGFVAYCGDADNLKGFTEVYKKGMDSVVLIGPEGDFSEKEFMFISDKSFFPIHFGNNILRTETAGVATCCYVYLKNL